MLNPNPKSVRESAALQPLQMSQTQHATPTPQLPLPVGWSSIGTLNLLTEPQEDSSKQGRLVASWNVVRTELMLSLNYLVLV